MKKGLLALAALALAGAPALTADTPASAPAPGRDSIAEADSLDADLGSMISSVLQHALPDADREVRFETLTEEDFRIVAGELGVEVAAIKAVAKIEAGAAFKGFWAPGVPVANYSQTLFNRYKAKTKGPKATGAKVPDGLKGYALKEWTALTNARKINEDAANMATYWGMFQIGGAHYKQCGCQNVGEMVALVSASEFSQLEMFGVFIRNAGMLENLRAKEWAAFARKYNGPAYAKRGYHTRMAKEYAAFKAAEGKSGNAAPLETAAAIMDTTQNESIKKSTPAPVRKTTARKKSKRRRRR